MFRRLLTFSAAFCAGTLLCVLLLSAHWALILAGVCVLLALCAGLFLPTGVRLRWVLLSLGLAIGLGYTALYGIWAVGPAARLDGETVLLTGRALEESQDNRVLTAFSLEGRETRGWLYYNEERTIRPGDAITVEATVKALLPEERTGVFLSYRSKGIFLRAIQSKRGLFQVTSGGAASIRDWGAAARIALSAQIRRLLPGETGRLLRALLYSDKADLSESRQVKLSVAGLGHLTAASGMHLSFLAGLLALLIPSRRKASLVTLPILFLFAALVGFTPSILRAAVMQGCLLLAPLFSRENDGPTALAAAVLIVLLPNPYAVGGISFQLSFACVAGLLFCARPVYLALGGGKRGTGLWARFRRFCSASVSASLGAMMFTLPLTFWYFGSASVLSVITNLPAVPLAAVSFGLGLAAVLLSLLCFPVAAVLAVPLRWALRGLLWISDTAVRIPFFSVGVENILVVGALALCYSMLLLRLLRKRPVRLSRVLAAGAVVIAALAVSAVLEFSGGFQVTLADVGQGQGIAVTQGTESLVFDCGGGAYDAPGREMAETLLHRGRTKIDGLILSHYDSDHTSGLETLIECLKIETVYLPEPRDDTKGQALRWLLKKKRIHICTVTEDQRFRSGGIETYLYAPEESTAKGNDRCLTAWCEGDGISVFFPADLSSKQTEALLPRLPRKPVTVLVVGHHGSKNATSERILKRLRPTVAVVSAGKNNWYGHPHRETLELFWQREIPVYGTMQNGTFSLGKETLPWPE